jgi:hypothetical protein
MGHRERQRNHCVLLINKVAVELAVVWEISQASGIPVKQGQQVGPLANPSGQCSCVQRLTKIMEYVWLFLPQQAATLKAFLLT